jgi:putative membrane protein
MLDLYLWLKVLHVISVIAWMAGLFYLPRLFVYHSEVAIGSESSELFKVMERRLFRIIMRPAMAVAWLAGLGLVWLVWDWSGWMWVKAASVIVMTVVHEHLGGLAKAFGKDLRPKSETYFRLVNEVPTVLMIVIVTMVIVKPF